MFDIGVILCNQSTVAAQTAAARFCSRTGFRRHGAPVSGALFYGRVALGQLRLRQFREVRWSANPASLGHQFCSWRSGSFERTSTVNSTPTPKNRATAPKRFFPVQKIIQNNHYVVSIDTMFRVRRALENIQEFAVILNGQRHNSGEPLGLSGVINTLAITALDDVNNRTHLIAGGLK
jgi:hypothetical protein